MKTFKPDSSWPWNWSFEQVYFSVNHFDSDIYNFDQIDSYQTVLSLSISGGQPSVSAVKSD